MAANSTTDVPWPDTSFFRDKPAVVTGAGHGIGLGIARGLLAAGADVCTVEIDPTRCESLTAERFRVVTADIASGAAVAGTVIECLGRIPQLIVNNVGIADGRTFLDLPAEAVEQTWRANVLGPWAFSHRLATELISAGDRGTFLFILSLHTASLGTSPDYSTSKAAAKMLVREMSHAVGRHGIRVNGLSPGAVDTWSDHRVVSPVLSDDTFALGRVGKVGDIVGPALALLDDTITGYVTGADMVVDGGLSLYNWLHGDREHDNHGQDREHDNHEREPRHGDSPDEARA